MDVERLTYEELDRFDTQLEKAETTAAVYELMAKIGKAARDHLSCGTVTDEMVERLARHEYAGGEDQWWYRLSNRGRQVRLDQARAKLETAFRVETGE